MTGRGRVRTLTIALTVVSLSLSPAARADDAADAKEDQTKAAAMAKLAGDTEKAATTRAQSADSLKTKAAAWSKAAAAWKSAADAWAAAPGDAAKKAAAGTARDAAAKAGKEHENAQRAATASTPVADYATRNLTVTAGAVVLNPFELESIDTDSNPATTEFRLETGDTDANFLLEAGFRRRWAWEAARSYQLESIRSELSGLRAQVAAERAKPKPSAKLIGEWEAAITGKRTELRDTSIAFSSADPSFSIPRWKEGESSFWPDLAAAVLPDNYAIRLGFALGAKQPSGAAAVAGAGDFYIETGVGFDWLRAQYPAGVEPLRLGFGP
jgi:hypothetical protein